MKQIPSEMFLKQGVLKICSKFTGEQPCRGRISTKLLVVSVAKEKIWENMVYINIFVKKKLIM